MPVVMREFTIPFTARSGSAQRATTTIPIRARPLPVTDVQAVLKGFRVGYANGDHHILAMEIDLDVTNVAPLSPTSGQSVVTVAADLLLRDSSGNVDDPFEGFVQGVLIAQVP